MPDHSAAAAHPQALGARLFSFAVIADTHLNQGETTCNSPFEVNRLANGRLRHVVRDLNTRDVAFVVNLGDLVHPVPAIPDLYAAAAERFQEQVAELRHPLHLVPGNHDVGDKPIDWGPAGVVTDPFLDLWGQYFGPHYFGFDHGECRFLVVNAQIINSGLAAEAAQKAWLEGELAASAGRRLFLHIHYPPYLCEPEEDEHYDNIAEPGRGWLLDLLVVHRVEALFAGHVHNFWYHRHGVTECYLLPSTAFVRQDYAEMYRAPPLPDQESGRNDAPKLGYFVVHVHARGHFCEVVRTYGRVVGPDAPERPAPRRVAAPHPRLNARAVLGFDLRQTWAEVVQIPPSGGLDEFDRKLVRNDYPVMALWEMGVRKLRVPLSDLADEGARARMRLLRDQGQEFTLFSYGVPGPRQRELILRDRDILEGWEVGYAPADLGRLAAAVAEIKAEATLPVYLTRLRSRADLGAAGEKYYHVINHGFDPGEAALIAELRARPEVAAILDVVVFRIGDGVDPCTTIDAAAALTRDQGLAAALHLRLGTANPAGVRDDDLWIANRLAEALAAAVVHDHVAVFVDTLADVDRGYFVRNGVIDRRFNPRLGFHVLRHLYGALGVFPDALTAGGRFDFEGGRGLILRGDTATLVLVLPSEARSSIVLPIKDADTLSAREVSRIDLKTGEIAELGTRVKRRGDRLEIAADLPANPILLSFA